MKRVIWLRAFGTAAFLALLLLAAPQKSRSFSVLTKWRADENFYYLESNGLPMHKMMVGITAWQQQVPLPQDFTGGNAFKIPRHPVMSDNPVSAKRALFSGAIAVAVNGVPIFNPIKNDGRTDTLIAGELDDFGGHCGRADDYHYHVAPLHLVDTVGIANPIGYALDGYPLYGLTEADGSTPVDLDEFNGHSHGDLGYHYHSTRAYPYVNGGLRGVVEVRNDAITPQPLTTPVRPAGGPLRGATIIGFTMPSPNRYSLEYQINGRSSFVNYWLNDAGAYTFEFVDADGNATRQNYNRAAPWPSLYTANPAGLASGFLTRTRNGQQTTEQFTQIAGNGQLNAVPIDVSSDEVALTLLGVNPGNANNLSASIGGVNAQVTMSPMAQLNSAVQYKFTIPQRLAGSGRADITLNVNGRQTNTVYVIIR